MEGQRSSSSSAPPLSWLLSHRSRYTVVKINCLKKKGHNVRDKMHSTATGFFINKKGVILTSSKFIPDDPNLCSFQCRQDNIYLGDLRLLIRDYKRCLVLMEFTDENKLADFFPKEVPYLIFGDSTKLSFESTLYGFGCPGDIVLLSSGVLSSRYERKIWNLSQERGVEEKGVKKCIRYHTTCAMNPGWEGGPLLNDKSEVVGVFFDQVTLNVKQPNLIAMDGAVQIRKEEHVEIPALSIRAYEQNATSFITTKDTSEFLEKYVAQLHPILILTKVGREEADSYARS